MRLAPYAALLTACVAIAGACSLFVPFDDYAGTNATEAGSDASAETDAEADARPLDPTCEGVNLSSDPSNCGACGRRCLACDAGRCPIEILADDPDAGNVTSADLGRRGLDGGDPAIYFAREAGVIARTDPDGGGYEAARAAGTTSLSFGAVNGVIGYNNVIEKFSSDHFLDADADVIANARGVGPILYAANRVFWGDADGMWWKVATKSNMSLTQFDAAVEFGPPVAITFSDAGFSFWTDTRGTVVTTALKAPGALSPVIQAKAEGTTAIAVSVNHIYLTRRSLGLLVYDFDGNNATFARQILLTDAESIVVDESHVYVTDLGGKVNGDDRLLRFDANGLSQLVLSDTVTGPRVFGVDDAYVYFSSGAKVARIAK